MHTIGVFTDYQTAEYVKGIVKRNNELALALGKSIQEVEVLWNKVAELRNYCIRLEKEGAEIMDIFCKKENPENCTICETYSFTGIKLNGKFICSLCVTAVNRIGGEEIGKNKNGINQSGCSYPGDTEKNNAKNCIN